MQETKESLNRIRNDEDGVNSEVETACLFAKKFDVDPEAEFSRIYRIRVRPRRLDSNPETQASMTIVEF